MQTTSQNLSRLETQIGQLAAQTSEREKGKLPSQTIPNPKTQCNLASSSTSDEQVQVITTLRSGRRVDTNVVNPECVQERAEEEEAGNKETQTEDNPPELEPPEQENNSRTKEPVPEPDITKYIPRAPFSQRLERSKKDGQYGDILELFKHVQINIPLLDAIKQVPAYAKFLKDLVTAKKKTNVPKKAFLTEQVSALILNKYPIKYKDPGSPTITCKIGNFPVDRALLDLGASINLLPYSTYLQLGLGDLKPTTMRIQLADHSIRIARGILEDVLIKVEIFYFPLDFVVIDTEPVSDTTTQVRIILGRPFLATANALINCRNGVMKISFGNMTLEMNIFHISRQVSPENDDLCELNFIDDFVNDSLTLSNSNSFDDYMASFNADFDIDSIISDVNSLLDSVPLMNIDDVKPIETPLTISEPSAKLDLKILPDTLKYVFLGTNDTFPVIIASDLTAEQEHKIIALLKEHKEAIGWTLSDIKGISPSTVMHRIHLEENAKTSRQHQRRLNPIMQEVVQNEILKLLEAGIIYPISDSNWVSPIQVVPKKSGLTVTENEAGELVPTRTQTGWRVCIDYRKLNEVTRKDHFPLPFIDQMLEKLAGNSYYCFLDGYSGYNQVCIAPEDQEKTTFTCPSGTFAFRRMPFGLCNAPATFQRCMLSIFSDMTGDILEIFMDDLSLFGSTFDTCLDNLSRVLIRCKEKNLLLNWEKCHFMVQRGIVLGHIISKDGIQVDKAKVDLISNLPPPRNIRGI